MAELIKREDVNEVIDALEVYTVGRMNTEKVQISVLQLQRLINALKNIPTAYDLEAMVAELEKLNSETEYCWMCGGGIDARKAISIVRNGGKE